MKYMAMSVAFIQSPLFYDKGHPIFGGFAHGRSFLEFWTPEVPMLRGDLGIFQILEF